MRIESDLHHFAGSGQNPICVKLGVGSVSKWKIQIRILIGIKAMPINNTGSFY
jgi:hypothetical protein